MKSTYVKNADKYEIILFYDEDQGQKKQRNRVVVEFKINNEQRRYSDKQIKGEFTTIWQII